MVFCSSYDVCEMIKNHKDTFCPILSDPNECSCPMKTGSYFMKNAFIVIPDFGEIFAKILQSKSLPFPLPMRLDFVLGVIQEDCWSRWSRETALSQSNI
ncbi:hypothetical protein NPIL_234011 [Nephila pilipes]|uniref:Uncharacterized protein n=1 Tax=Nephila pilipes TaxID=299642 RepID=A0A8X6TVF5_NEPPI|nr:hypothetical protein NPIL_592751 [Nephila pilipes]GFT47759.1 hypothetical protein NPIL_659621 [Nephila pilipes]GFT87570.1 hypothetical protein NPIL_228211 [Nephila pilipes]GFU18629.1 hypothetical protein NPIL_234011 [Nephila pilipes]